MNKSILILSSIIILIGLVLGILIIRNKNSADQAWYRTDLTPQFALEKLIHEHLREKFWPARYEVITEADNSEIVSMGLGRQFANNYGVEWSGPGYHILAIVGFDKQGTKEINGFAINIDLKGNYPDGQQLAYKYLKNIPNKQWLKNGPSSEKGIESIASVHRIKSPSENYVRVIGISTQDKQISLADEVIKSFFQDNDELKQFTKIHYVTFLSNHPRYGLLEELQELDNKSYSGN